MKKSNPLKATLTLPVTACIPATALAAINHILGAEGGNVNDSTDHGGKTNYGISDLRDGKEDGLIDIDLDGIGDIDPEDLTRDQAIVIFYQDYWLANKCDKMPECIALIVFDIAVNQSAVFARKRLQEFVGATPDGIIGPNTLDQLALVSNSYILHALTHARCLRYADKVKKNPTQLKYISGWINRAFTVLFEAQAIDCFGGYE